MEKILTSDELLKHIFKMDSNNSIFQFLLPGKGKFTLVFQEGDAQTIQTDVASNKELDYMFTISEEQYKKGLGLTTSELLDSLSEKDFM